MANQNNQKKKTIYILLEVQSRELNSQLLLAIFFLNKGYRIYIGDSKSIFHLLKKKTDKGGIFLNKGTSPYNETKLIKKKCDEYVVLDQELTPGFNDKIFDYTISARVYDRTVKYIDRYYVINNAVAARAKKIFKKLGGNAKILVAGWPRIDLLKENFLSFYKTEIKKHKKKYKKHILFNSDFGSITEEEIQKVRNNILTSFEKDKPIAHQKKRIFFINDQLNHQLDNLNNTKAFLKKLSYSYPKMNFVIRSHPGEHISGWHKFCKNLKNFKVQAPTNAIAVALLSADAVIHRGCTTSYETVLLNKKSGYINVTGNEKLKLAFRKKLYDNSYKINNLKNFNDFLKKKKFISAHKKNIEIFFNLKKYHYACEKIFNDFDKIDINKENSWNDIRFKFHDHVKSKFIFSFKRLIYDLLILFKIKPERNKKNWNKVPKINKDFNAVNIKKIIYKMLGTKKFSTFDMDVKVTNLSEKLIEIDSIKN